MTVSAEIMFRVQLCHLKLEANFFLARKRCLDVSVYDLISNFFLVQIALYFLCDFVPRPQRSVTAALV